MSKSNLDLARECDAIFPILADLVIFTPAQLDAFAERIRAEAKADAPPEQEPVAAELTVRRAMGIWQRYNIYPSIMSADDAKRRIEGDGIEVSVNPLFLAPPAPQAREPLSEPAVSHCINHAIGGTARDFVRFVEKQCAVAWGVELAARSKP